MEAYIKLGIAALLPVVFSAILYVFDKKTAFGKLPKWAKQLIFGVIYGGLAIIGTEWGIPYNGAQLNCRDAAVLTGGLLFGAPAGIIAGVIGGAERWIAVRWGVGTFTQLACTLSTIIAGLYAAALRKFMFEDKKPGWLISLAIGIVMEVFHMTMVFITNMSTPIEAMTVVKTCAPPMIIANGVSLMLSVFIVTMIGKELKIYKSKARISQTIQRWMLVAVSLAFLATSYFVYSLQTRIAESQADNLLELALNEVSADIEDASDENMLAVTRKIAAEFNTEEIDNIVEKYGVAEISLVDKSGYIIQSNVTEYIGFDMSSGPQSAEFLQLLSTTKEFVQSYGTITSDPSIMRKYAGVKTDVGFIQVGYDAEMFQKEIDSNIIGITKNRHVGKTGFVLILDIARQIVSSPSGITADDLRDSPPDAVEPDENTTFILVVNGEDSLCRYCTSEGYYIVSVLPMSEAMQMRNIAIYVNTFMEILVFAILFAIIYFLIKKVVVNRIKSINGSLSKISQGDLGVVVNVRSSEEFASLSDDINTTVDTLKNYIAEASARIDKELEVAKNIQSSALPNVFPAFPKRKDFDIFASMDPAKEVGGDFYDFYLTNNDKLHFLIADVSGKGIPAAMFMMRAKTELKTLTESDISINDVFTNGNNALCEGNDAGMFVTAWQGSIDLTTGHVRYANAGHNPPLIKKNGGKFEYLRTKVGFVLAGMEDVCYKLQEFDLEPGDMIYLYTDGVTEATDASEKLYGEERLLEAVNAKEFENVKELCEYVRADVDKFVGDAPQFDDITMVAFRFNGLPEVPSMYFENAKIDDIPALTEFAEAELEKLDCPMKTVVQINVAIDEIFSNIVRYGYKGKGGPVTVKLIEREEPHTVSLQFIDEGIPYNPLTKSDPDVTLSAEQREIGGLGIFMVKKTMDDIKYEYENEKNVLTITKNI